MTNKLVGAGIAALSAVGCATGNAATAERQVFGTLADGTEIESIVLQSENGMKATVITLGGILQSLLVADREGALGDVVLGFEDPQGYLDNPAYLGATIGRYANRIAEASFTLDGQTYELPANEAGNQLHGGPEGFDKQVWEIVEVAENAVTLQYVSEDGEMGFPGTLTARVTYSLSGDGELTILHEATTDKPTIVNMTNHSYFNLSGGEGDRTVYGHILSIPAERFTPINEQLIPTGEVVSVADTPFDFRDGKAIGRDVRQGGSRQLLIAQGYDHNFVLGQDDGTVRLAARLEDPASGRVMEMLTDQPAVQFYSGNFLDGTMVGKGGRIYRQGDGLCLEPQVYPNAPNEPAFPSARLDPEQTYRNKIVLRFSVGR